MSKEQDTKAASQEDETIVDATNPELSEEQLSKEQPGAGSNNDSNEQSADEDIGSEESSADLSDAEKLTLLANDLAKAKEDVLRAQAEVQNSRRRSEADVEKARKFALERLVSDLLPVIDNLDRALDAIDQSDELFKAVVEGIELTHKSFLDTLAKHQVVQIDPVSEPFDPETHQAMTMVPNLDLEPNTVMEVFQKGYSLNKRLIRPAMVVVSKAID